MPFDGVQLPPATQALIASRARLERGWCQFRMQEGETYCMHGALRAESSCGSAQDLRHRHSLLCLLYIAMRSLGYSYPDIPDFNDAIGRTKAEVLEVYDRAIELSMKEQSNAI